MEHQVIYRCPYCGSRAEEQAAECDRCKRHRRGAPITLGAWRTDTESGGYAAISLGAEHLAALGLVSFTIVLFLSVTGSLTSERLWWSVGALWLAYPLLFLLMEWQRPGWSMQFLPGFLFVFVFLSMLTGVVCILFGETAGFVGLIPILFTVFGGGILVGKLWPRIRPFENVFRAVTANIVALSAGYLLMLPFAYALLHFLRKLPA